MSHSNRSGVVSIVVVHTTDEPVDSGWLATLSARSGPVGTELIVVDCSAAGHRGGWPGTAARTIASGPRVGLAAARNRGADSATGELLAFLAPGAAPEPGWLDGPVALLAADGAVSCVSPVAAGAGTPGLSFTGHPVTVLEADPRVDADVLHPRTEAMVCKADAFRDVGGFDETYERFGEEVDLGWRLWLLGHRVRRSASSVVRLDDVAAPAVEPRHRRFLTERNALRTIYKHYERANLDAALPAALALCAQRADGLTDAHRAAASRAVSAFTDDLAALERARAGLQRARRRSDHEIVRLFVDPLCAPQGMAGEYRAAVASFGLAERFGTRRRVAVITADALTARMAGPAIRAREVATALASEHEVRLASTTRCEIEATEFSVELAGEKELRDLQEWCDVMVVQGWVLHGRPHLRQGPNVLVVDLYDPLHLEQLELGRAEHHEIRGARLREATGALNDQLARGDFFICASAKQRDFWLGQMAGIGRLNPLTYDEDQTLESLIRVVPFGLREAAPVHDRPALKGVVPGIADDDEVILWGGGVYNWLDPVTLVKAVDRLRARRPNVRLFFLGLRHPNPEVQEMRSAVEARAVADELRLTGTHVFFNEEWVPYADRHNYLLEADVGVSTHLKHLETEFSFRSRVLDYLWAALPIVATDGDAFAELIEREALGLTVPPGDVAALEDALFRLLDDREFAAVCRKNLASVRGRFAWPEVLAPLVEFCRAPRRAPDLVEPGMAVRAPVALPTRPRGLGDDVATALAYLREGGLRLVGRKARSRLGHWLLGAR